MIISRKVDCEQASHFFFFVDGGAVQSSSYMYMSTSSPHPSGPQVYMSSGPQFCSKVPVDLLTSGLKTSIYMKLYEVWTCEPVDLWTCSPVGMLTCGPGGCAVWATGRQQSHS